MKRHTTHLGIFRFLSAFLMLICLITSNITLAFANISHQYDETPVSLDSETHSAVIEFDNSIFGIDSDIFEASINNSSIITSAKIKDYKFLEIANVFKSKKGDVGIIRQNTDGTYSPIEITSEPSNDILGDGTISTEEVDVYDWSKSYKTFEEASKKAGLSSEIHAYFSSSYDTYEGSAFDYLNQAKVFILDSNRNTILETNMCDLYRSTSTAKVSNMPTLAISLVNKDDINYDISVLFNGKAASSFKVGDAGTEYVKELRVEHIVEGLETKYEGVPSSGVATVALRDKGNILVVVETNVRSLSGVINIASDIVSESSSTTVKDTTITPKLSVTGIPEKGQTKGFTVKLNTDIPCSLTDEDGIFLGSTDEGEVPYYICKGNKEYKITCTPLKGLVVNDDGSNIFYDKIVESFTIDCFDSSYVVPTDDNFPSTDEDSNPITAIDENPDSFLSEDFNHEDLINSSNTLAQTGVYTSAIIVPILLGISLILIAVYKREWLKKIISGLLVIALLTSVIPITQVYANTTGGGSISTTEGPNAPPGSLCTNTHSVVYKIYPVDIRGIAPKLFGEGGIGSWEDDDIHSTLQSSFETNGKVLVHSIGNNGCGCRMGTCVSVSSDTSGKLSTVYKDMVTLDTFNKILSDIGYNQSVSTSIFNMGSLNTVSISDAVNYLDTLEIDKKRDFLEKLFGISYSKQEVQYIQLVVEIGIETHVNGSSIGYVFSPTLTEYNKSGTHYTEGVFGNSTWETENLGETSILNTGFYTTDLVNVYPKLYQKTYAYGENTEKDVMHLTYNSGTSEMRYKGVIFVFTGKGTTINTESTVYDYAILAKGTITDFKTDLQRVMHIVNDKYQTYLFRRARKYDVTGGAKNLISTTYEYWNSNSNSWLNANANTLDLNAMFKRSGYEVLERNGYDIVKGLENGIINTGGFSEQEFFDSLAKPQLTNQGTEGFSGFGYKYQPSAVSSGYFQAGNKYDLAISQSYLMGLYGSTAYAGYWTSKDSFNSLFKNSILSKTTSYEDYKNRVKDRDSGDYWNKEKYIISNHLTFMTNPNFEGYDINIPVTEYVEYKPLEVKSTVYKVELSLNPSGEITVGNRTKLKDCTYKISTDEKITTTKDDKYVVIVNKDSAYKGMSNITYLNDIDNKCFSSKDIVSSGEALSGDKIVFGATDKGVGYDIYLFSINTDELNLSGDYSLQEYQINRLYNNLRGDINNKTSVYTSINNRLYAFNEHNNITYSSNKLNLLRSTNGNTISWANGSLSMCSIFEHNRNANNWVRLSNTSSCLSLINSSIANFDTNSSYNVGMVMPLHSFSIECVRAVAGDNKVLSNFAVGNEKYFIDSLDDTTKTKYGLTLGDTATVVAFNNAAHKSFEALKDINSFVFEGRFYYNKRDYRNTAMHSTNSSDAYSRTTAQSVQGDSNYMLTYKNLRWRTLNYAANVLINKYNPGSITKGVAGVNDTLIDEANRIIVANDLTYKDASGNDKPADLYFYPEVNMQMTVGNNVYNYLPTIGEYKRTTQSAILAGMTITSSNSPSGSTTGDMIANDKAIYRGSDVTLLVDNTGLDLSFFGYGLDIIDASTDGTMKTSASNTVNFNAITNGVDVRTDWGNNSSIVNYMKDAFNNIITSQIGAFNVSIELKTHTGKTYNNFDISYTGAKFNTNDTKNDMTFPITVKKGKLVDNFSYQCLIKQIAKDYNCSEDDAKTLFENSNIVKAIIDSMETCVNSSNKSISAPSNTNLGDANHWYDEYTRTFVIRRFTNDSIKFGDIVVQDKIDMNANDSNITGSGINQSVTGNNVKAKWSLTVKRGNQIVMDNVNIGNADFDISYLTTED